MSEIPAAAEAATTDSSSHGYDVQSEHARGGIGRVLKAWDRRLKRPVAIKELLSVRREHARRFMREVEITARLQHPSIVPVYEAGRWPDGAPFYAMKFVTGRTLRQLIVEAHTLDQRLGLLPNVLAVADAIAYAHSQGIVHRDLKPSNVIVGSFGETVVIDWGLAKALYEGEVVDDLTAPYRSPADGHTVAGAVVGTPSYMPPEQARGGAVDARADVYALGSILYHVLTGEPPFTGASTNAILDQVIGSAPESVERREPGVPPDLAALVAKAMARDPEARYASAEALADDLRRFQTGQLVGAHHYSRATLALRWMRKNHSPLAVATVLLLLLAASLTLAVRRIVRERNAARIERSVAEQRALELTLTQARTALETDPTAALRTLAHYPANAPGQEEARAIAADAASRGVSRFVLRVQNDAVVGALSPDGATLVSDGEQNAIRVWKLPSGMSRLIRFTGFANAISFSRDGSRLAVAGENGHVAVWDGELIGPGRDLGGLHDMVEQAELAADARTLIGLDSRGEVCWWDLETGACRLLTLPRADERLIGYAGESPIAVVAHDGDVDVWDVAHATKVARLQHGSHVSVLTLLASAHMLLTASAKELVAWDLTTRTRIRSIPLHAAPNDVVVSADGRRVAYWFQQHSIVTVDLHDGTEKTLELPQRVYTSVFSPDGTKLAIGGVGGRVTVWDVGAGATQSLVGHGGLISRLGFSDDGRWLFTCGGEDHTVRVWNVESPAQQVLAEEAYQTLKVVFAPSGDRIGTANSGGTARSWRLGDAIPLTLRFHDLALDIAFSPDSAWFAAASWDHTVRWSSVDGRLGGSLQHEDRAQHVVWLDNGERLATASWDGKISVWNLRRGERVVLGHHRSGVSQLLLAPDGVRLASAGGDGTIRLWDPRRRSEHLVTHASSGIADIAFSPDGTHIAGGGYDGTLAVWDVATGTSRTLRGPGSPIDAVAISPDGRTIAATDDGGELLLYDGDSARPRVFRGHTGVVRNLAFSPDGRLIATAGFDQTARVWDVRSGDSAILRGHEGHVISVAFSPDGRTLATSGSDATARLWSVARVKMLPVDADRFHDWLSGATNVGAEIAK